MQLTTSADICARANQDIMTAGMGDQSISFVLFAQLHLLQVSVLAATLESGRQYLDDLQ